MTNEIVFHGEVLKLVEYISVAQDNLGDRLDSLSDNMTSYIEQNKVTRRDPNESSLPNKSGSLGEYANQPE